MQKKFLVGSSGTDEALGRALEFIHDNLAALKLNDKDTNRAVLMCEESLLRLFTYADFAKNGAFRVRVRKFFGDVLIDLTVPGGEFDFAGSIKLSSEAEEEISPDAEAAIQKLVLRSFADALRYKHSRHFNKITIKASQSNYSGLYKTLTSLALAVITGLAAKLFLPESVYMPVNDNILAAVKTIFMNGLKMCAVPIVFFSIASTVSDMGNLSGLRRAGIRLLRWFGMMKAATVIVGFGIAGLLGTGKGAGFHAVSASSVNAGDFQIMNMLINLMPENIVRPFLEGNMLQLILVAFLAGVAAASTGAEIMIQLFNEINRIFMRITSYLMKFMPLVIFCSITSMIITTGLNTILTILGLLLTLWAGYILMNVIYCLALKFFAGLNPAQLYRKSVPTLITAFTTCSSSASLPDLMKSAEALGISQKLYSFSLPLGVSINRLTSCVYLAVCVLSASHMYGVNITWAGIISIGVSAIVINMTAPGVPGETIISLSVLLSQAGIPLEFIPVVMSIDTLQDMINTPSNCAGNLTCTLLTAEKENLLDLETYNRK